MITDETTANDSLNSGVFRPTMFICGNGAEEACVVYAVRPSAEIAAALLEETTDWQRSLDAVPAEMVPEGVSAALAALHSAVYGWNDWLTHERRSERKPFE